MCLHADEKRRIIMIISDMYLRVQTPEGGLGKTCTCVSMHSGDTGNIYVLFTYSIS